MSSWDFQYNGYNGILSPLSAGKVYELSMRVKIKGATVPAENAYLGNFWLQVKAENRFGADQLINGNNIIQNKLWEGTGDTDGWIEISTYISGMANDVSCLHFHYTGVEELWFDDISIFEVTPEITGASITAGTDITVNYYTNYVPNASMKFTVNEEEVVVDGYYNAEIDKYVYRFPNIAPDRLNDEIKAELIKDGQVVAVKEVFTVKQYLDTVLSKTAEDLGMAEEKFAKLKTLAADLLHYGAAAQNYFGYKTDELVNDGVTEGTAFVAPATTDKDVTNKSADGVTFSGQNLRFDNVNRLMFRFNVDSSVITDITKLSIKIAVGNELKTVTSEDFENAGADTYIVYTDDIFATEFDDVFTVTACVDGTDGANVKYSVNSYVYSMCNSTTASEKMVELAKATYNYGISATAYIE